MVNMLCTVPSGHFLKSLALCLVGMHDIEHTVSRAGTDCREHEVDQQEDTLQTNCERVPCGLIEVADSLETLAMAAATSLICSLKSSLILLSFCPSEQGLSG
jgi:hypothetical protein